MTDAEIQITGPSAAVFKLPRGVNNLFRFGRHLMQAG